MKYIPVKGQSEYCQMIRDLSGAYDKNAKTPDYLEATVYNKNEVTYYSLFIQKILLKSKESSLLNNVPNYCLVGCVIQKRNYNFSSRL